MRSSVTNLVVGGNLERAECFADDVTLETAGPVARGLALGSSSIHKGPGLLVTSHADLGDAPEGVVSLSVPRPVETVWVGLTRRGQYAR
jgi:hypothetical protein